MDEAQAVRKAVAKLAETPSSMSLAEWQNVSRVFLAAADEIERLRDALNCEIVSRGEYEIVLADHRRLVRELDVALNGEAGAAQQASLCDIVGQVKDERWKLVRGV